MIRVTEIAFTGYPVTDMARARRFYEGLLGLKPSAAFDHDGREWVEYDVGPATIAVTNMSQDQWRPSSDGPAVALEVENFDEAVAALRGADVMFCVEPLESPSCRLAVVSDPDGNSIAIHRRNPHG
jgi:catechol 2,3-dioxygenase-like lactoylglutathione lyase family enzyme